MEVLNTHMKNIHLESDHERIARLTKSFTLALNPEYAVGFDCSECGELFSHKITQQFLGTNIEGRNYANEKKL